MKRLLLLAIFALPLSGMQSHTIKEYTQSAAVGGTVAGSMILPSMALMTAIPFSIPVVATGMLAGIGARFLYNQAMKPNPNDQILKEFKDIQ